MIVFSGHAENQLKRRKIPRHEVLTTVRNPDKTKQSFRGRMVYQKMLGSKLLEVIAIAEGSRVTIVTQYYIGV